MPEPLTSSLLGELLKQLHAAFPRNVAMQNPQLVADTYRNGLRELSGDAVRWAVDRVIREDEYFPKVARLRDLAYQWQRANQATIDAEIPRPTSWCDACRTVARPARRWRPRIDKQGRRILDGTGRLWLEQFERVVCGCDAPCRYAPDDDGTEYMTEHAGRPTPTPTPSPTPLRPSSEGQK